VAVAFLVLGFAVLAIFGDMAAEYLLGFTLNFPFEMLIGVLSASVSSVVM